MCAPVFFSERKGLVYRGYINHSVYINMYTIPHRIHVWYIYANIGGILMGSMLPYIAYMDPMGTVYTCIDMPFAQRHGWFAMIRHAGHVLPFARCEGRYPHRVLALEWCWGPVSYRPAVHTKQLPSSNLQVWFYQFYPVERNAYLPLKSGIFIGRVHLHRYVRTSSLRALGPGRRRRSR